MNEDGAVDVVRGADNVFEDLGFGAEEAMNLKIRADLMLDLREYIQEKDWTRGEAAVFFAETEARISSLMSGEVNDFSVDELITMLAKAGMRVRVEVLPEAA